MKWFFSISSWLMELFNPPRRESLSLLQKLGRVALVTVTLVTVSIIAALGLALVLFLGESGGRFLQSVPQLADALWIVGVSIIVNVVCVMALFQIKRLDQRLISPPEGPRR